MGGFEFEVWAFGGSGFEFGFLRFGVSGWCVSRFMVSMFGVSGSGLLFSRLGVSGSRFWVRDFTVWGIQDSTYSGFRLFEVWGFRVSGSGF